MAFIVTPTNDSISYDPWGNRRKSDNWAQLITTPVSHITGRGYTMHEHLDEFALINMNGRVYDPMVARFLSPDPYIQAPGNWLNYNRYAYCFNNPLIFTDPTGMKTWFGKFFSWVGTGAKNAWDWTQDGLDNFSAWANKIELPPIGYGVGLTANTWKPYHRVNVAGYEVYNSSRNYTDPAGNAMESFNRGMGNYYANTQGADLRWAASSAVGGSSSSYFYGIGVGLNSLGTATIGGEMFLNNSISFLQSMNNYSAPVALNYSKEIGLVTKATKSIKTIGGVTILAGGLLDGYGVYSYYKYGSEDSFSVHPGKAGLNLGIGVYSFYLNPIVAPIYFGVDLFYPGGWPAAIEHQGILIERNQRILGPSWNMYKDLGGF